MITGRKIILSRKRTKRRTRIKISVERREICLPNRHNGYRTLITNGNRHYVVDTCFTHDHGNEVMVFEGDAHGQITSWLHLDCEYDFPTRDMKDKHEKMVRKWTDKIEAEFHQE